MSLTPVADMRAMLLIGGTQLVFIGAALAALLFVPIPTQNDAAVGLLIGALIANSGQVVNYFFGTSKSSHAKDTTITTLAQTAQTAQAALAPLPDAHVIPVAAGESVTVTADPEKPQ